MIGTTTQTDIDGKVCRVCGQYKLLTDYHVERDTPTGRQAMCKPCRKHFNDINNPISKHAYAIAGGFGRYKEASPEDRRRFRTAARELLATERAWEQAERVKAGVVYMIVNPAWRHWYKIGCATDADSRCSSYNTGDPYRGYTVYAKSALVDNAYAKEQEFHAWLDERFANNQAYERRGEWFYLTAPDAEEVEMELAGITP